MPKTLEQSLNEIVSRAVAEIAKAVRASMVADVTRFLGSSVAPAPERAATRAPGEAPKATKQPKVVKTRKPRRGVADTDVTAALEYVKKNPGQRTEQIRAALNLDSDYGGKVLAKLRAEKKVKTKGEKRATTYSAA